MYFFKKKFNKITRRYIKPLNKKNKHNKFFIMLKRNSTNVHCKFGARRFWKFFERFR